MKTEYYEELKKYVDLPYTIILKKDSDGDYIAEVKELKGCIAHGANAAEALVELDSMKVLWLESCFADGATVPLPETEEDLPSGKWLQRVPRQLHAQLVKLAEVEEVSLNQLVVSVLAKEVGFREGEKKQTSVTLNATEALDPWAMAVDRIGTHLNWQMQKSSVTESIDKLFIGQLVESLPATTKSSVDIGIYEEKNKHSAWN